FEFGTTKRGKNAHYMGGLGCALEMGDAVLGMVIDRSRRRSSAQSARPSLWELSVDAEAAPPKKAPQWLVIRNASDPTISAKLSKPDQASEAAGVYKKYGYWTSVNSALATWAIIASMRRPLP